MKYRNMIVVLAILLVLSFGVYGISLPSTPDCFTDNDCSVFNKGGVDCRGGDCVCTSNSCVKSVCQNNVKEGLEDCDDGNSNNDDACSSTCTLTFCGDGDTQQPNGNDLSEQCDDGVGNSNSCVPGRDGECTVCTDQCLSQTFIGSFCGDSQVDSAFGETCDDGNTVNDDGCTNGCLLPACGDGIQQNGEACDDGNSVNTDSCTNACTLAVCGDSFTQTGEECDDGNDNNNDGCTNSCTVLSCGDGFIQGSEQCDDGVNNADSCVASRDGSCDVCTTACVEKTVVGSSCGDGNVDSHFEQCDDGNTNSNDGCSSTCRDESCGDGIQQSNEACDLGSNNANTGTCTDACSLATCGDGFTQSGETCDDGNSDEDDGCSSSCQIEFCGDEIRQANEACDAGPNGNLLCTSSCTLTFCGDGVTQIENGEEVDEACDDGNSVESDGCNNICQLTICGDDIVQQPNGNLLAEVCDDGTDNANNCVATRDGTCSFCDVNTCQPADVTGAFCGDGNFDIGDEQCSDSNAAGFCVEDCNQNIKPEITFISPSAGDNMPLGQEIEVEVRVVDRDVKAANTLQRIDFTVKLGNSVVSEERITSIGENQFFTHTFTPVETGSYSIQVKAIDSDVTVGSIGAVTEVDATIQLKTVKELGIGDNDIATYTLNDESIQITDPPEKPSLTSRFVLWLRGLVGFAVRTSVIADADQSKVVNNGADFKAFLSYTIVNSASQAVKRVGPTEIEVGRVEKLDVLFDDLAGQDGSNLFGWDPFDRDISVQSVEDIFGLYQLKVHLEDSDGVVIRNTDGRSLAVVSDFRIAELCGDGRATGDEVCDESEFAGKVCSDFLNSGGKPFTGGSLTCSDSCDLSTTVACVTEPGCENGLRDSDISLQETDVDCGGPIVNGCSRCAITQACGVDTDCGSGLICQTNVCVKDPVCGDSVLDEGEACDDGNTVNNDVCSSTCTNTFCSDSVQQSPNGAGQFESCDDGNVANNDGCNSVCQNEQCGDGVQQNGESCDDGNTNNGDGCSASCNVEVCGDGVVQTPNAAGFTELCDDGVSGSDTCNSQCTFTFCGDGVRQSGEACDDGNGNNNDGCSATCSEERCGDGIVQTIEGCDLGLGNSNTGSCTLSCSLAECGDGFRQVGEACDDGDANSNTGSCTLSCNVAGCGDGFLQSGEACDDGNNLNTDSCTNACVAAVCGDSFVQSGEECDFGVSNSNTGICTTSCLLPTCGDGFRQGVEQCDEGEQNSNTGSCTLKCRTDLCGDGFVQSGEFCDDGNTNSGDGCSNSCLLEVCGDGIVQTPNRDGQNEACDDGNTVDTDSCTNACEASFCGDGTQQSGEACDDGNEINNDGCSDLCVVEFCGDGIQQASEACDDGNLVNNDACSSSCEIEVCGDQIIQTGEQCDDGNFLENDACTNSCRVTTCGDGRVQVPNGEGVSESCDDGNSVNNDECSNSCRVTFCGDGIIQSGGNGLGVDEGCDDGADNANSCVATRDGTCSFCDVNTCQPADVTGAFCGDGNFDIGDEQCSDSNAAGFCLADCDQNILPDISILEPENGDIIPLGKTVNIIATVTDQDINPERDLEDVEIIVELRGREITKTKSNSVGSVSSFSFPFLPEQTGDYVIKVIATDSVDTEKSIVVRSEIDASIQMKTLKDINLPPGEIATYTLLDKSVQLTDPPDPEPLVKRVVGWLRGLVGFAVRASVVAEEDQSKIVNRGAPFEAFIRYQIIQNSLAIKTIGPVPLAVDSLVKLDITFDELSGQSNVFGWIPTDRVDTNVVTEDLFGSYQFRAQLLDSSGTVLHNKDENSLTVLSPFVIAPTCGDTIRTGDEVCDTTDFGSVQCSDFLNTAGNAFTGGSLSCGNSCEAIDKSQCVTAAACENGLLDAGNPLFETDTDCGGPVANGCSRCAITDSCLVNSDCGTGLLCESNVCVKEAVCGDGVLDEGEVCDGSSSGAQPLCTDHAFGSGTFDSGVVGCAADCGSYILTECNVCGNNELEDGEQCDGSVPSGTTCNLVDPDNTIGKGTLSCSSSCTLDEGACLQCQDDPACGSVDDIVCDGGRNFQTCELVNGCLQLSTTSSCSNVIDGGDSEVICQQNECRVEPDVIITLVSPTVSAVPSADVNLVVSTNKAASCTINIGNGGVGMSSEDQITHTRSVTLPQNGDNDLIFTCTDDLTGKTVPITETIALRIEPPSIGSITFLPQGATTVQNLVETGTGNLRFSTDELSTCRFDFGVNDFSRMQETVGDGNGRNVHQTDVVIDELRTDQILLFVGCITEVGVVETKPLTIDVTLNAEFTASVVSPLGEVDLGSVIVEVETNKRAFCKLQVEEGLQSGLLQSNDRHTHSRAFLDLEEGTYVFELLCQSDDNELLTQSIPFEFFPNGKPPSCNDGSQNGDESDVDCGGSCGGCGISIQCGVSSDCSSNFCSSGVCAEASCTDEIQNGQETAVDCGGSCICTTGQACQDNNQCDSSSCTAQGVCGAATCIDGIKNQDESSVDCGGSCKGCGTEVFCNIDSDCRDGICGSINSPNDHLCAAPSCFDSVQNGLETGLNCGRDCAACNVGNGCLLNSDCVEGVCDSGSGLCAAASCNDRVLNGGESGVDCGGSCSATCDVGIGCFSVTDCSSGICSSGVCTAPTCEDGLQNQGESDVDCGGSCGVCGAGDTCTEGSDCSSNKCKGGFCTIPSCSDSVLNQDETGIDCGGDVCGTCQIGETCSVGDDCISDICVGQVCAAQSCTDGIQNQDEKDVDCGGVCGACSEGNSCDISSDCTSNVCKPNVDGDFVCQAPSCDDTVKNGNEADVDCGGSCDEACVAGNTCSIISDCSVDTTCTNGVCVACRHACDIDSETVCTDDFKQQICDDVDGDHCRDPSFPLSCSAGEFCVNDGCELLLDNKLTLVEPSFGIANTGTFRVVVETDRDATCRQSTSDVVFDQMGAFNVNNGDRHVLNQLGFIGNQGSLFVTCVDVVTQESFSAEYALSVDKQPPKIIVSASPNPIVESPALSLIRVEGSTEVHCRISGSSTVFDEMEDLGKGEFSDSHTYKTPHLPDGGSTFNVVCRNRAGGEVSGSVTLDVDLGASFVVKDRTDDLFVENSGVLRVGTNKAASCSVERPSGTVVMEPDAGNLVHALTLVGLVDGLQSQLVTCESFESQDVVSLDISFDVAIGGVKESCIDGILNQDESSVDCGGEVCGACSEGDRCKVVSDCDIDSTCGSGVCVACQHECVDTGVTVCNGLDIQTCQDADKDHCRELSEAVSCAVGQVCQDDVCSAPTVLKGKISTPAFGEVDKHVFRLEVETSRVATCVWDTFDRSFDDMKEFTGGDGSLHTVEGVNIPGRVGGVFVRCVDPLADGVSLPQEISFNQKIIVDPNPPIIEFSIADPNPITDIPEKTSLIVHTDKPSVCDFVEGQVGTNGLEGDFPGKEDGVFITEHEVILDKFDLSQKEYEFRVTCESKAGVSVAAKIPVTLASDELFKITDTELAPISDIDQNALEIVTNKLASCELDLDGSKIRLKQEDRLHYTHLFNELTEREYPFTVTCLTNSFQEDTRDLTFRAIEGGENCHDGFQNQLGTELAETDVDCGGDNTCDRCEAGKKCVIGVDCVSQVCGVDGLCQVASCSDGVHNQDEEKIDCGGDICARCPNIPPVALELHADKEGVEIGDSVKFICEASDEESSNNKLIGEFYLRQTESPNWNLKEKEKMFYSDEDDNFVFNYQVDDLPIGQEFVGHCVISDDEDSQGLTNADLGVTVINSLPVVNLLTFEPLDLIQKKVRFICRSSDKNEDESSLDVRMTVSKDGRELFRGAAAVDTLSGGHFVDLSGVEEGVHDITCEVFDQGNDVIVLQESSVAGGIRKVNVDYNAFKDDIDPVFGEIRIVPFKDRTTVFWAANELVNGTLLVKKLKDGSQVGIPETTFKITHETLATGLEPSTDYSVAIIASDPSGNIAPSKTLSFTTTGASSCNVDTDCDLTQMCIANSCRKIPVCGDNVADFESFYAGRSDREVCDLGDAANLTCTNYPGAAAAGFTGGALSCVTSVPTCGFGDINTSQCFTCGDGTHTPEKGEVCEVNMKTTCGALGIGVGEATCSNSCEWDVSECSFCGNNVCEAAEGENAASCGVDCKGEGASCNLDEQCETGYECTPGKLCTITSKIECRTNSTCSSGEFCNDALRCADIIECTRNSDCDDGYRCSNDNKCKIEKNYQVVTPDTVSPVCTPNWTCSAWSPVDCPASRQQTRSCISTNNCFREKPSEQQSCTHVPITTRGGTSTRTTVVVQPGTPSTTGEPTKPPRVEFPSGSTASCLDRVQNQGESGIDCGGPCKACKIIVCGDNVCSAEETEDSCPADCGGEFPWIYVFISLGVLGSVLMGGLFIHFERKSVKVTRPKEPFREKVHTPVAVPHVGQVLAGPKKRPRAGTVPVESAFHVPKVNKKDEARIKALENLSEPEEKDPFVALESISLKKGIGKKVDTLRSKVSKKKKLSSEQRLQALRRQIDKTKQRVEEIEDEY